VDDDQNKDNGFKKALLGAAYFPKELDPLTKSLPLTRLSDFKFLHRQLADAVFYEHPLAGIYLREIAGICNVPLDNPIDSPDFYKRFYDTDDVDLRDYNEYVLKFILPVKNHPEGAQAEQTDVAKKENINEKITFPSYSRGLKKYFRNLLEQSPEKRKWNTSKRKIMSFSPFPTGTVVSL